MFRGSHKITASASELLALSLGRDLMTPLAKAAEQVGWDNKFLLFRYYQDTMIGACAAGH